MTRFFRWLFPEFFELRDALDAQERATENLRRVLRDQSW